MSRHAIYCHLFDTNNPCLPCRVARCHPLSIAFESPRGIRRSFRLMAPPLPLPPSSPSIGSAERSLLFFILFVLLSLSPLPPPVSLPRCKRSDNRGRFLMNFFSFILFHFFHLLPSPPPPRSIRELALSPLPPFFPATVD